MKAKVSALVDTTVRPERIDVQSILLSSENQLPGSYPIKNWDVLDGAMLAVHSLVDDVSYCDGSAVMVAPGIALMATHVLNEILQRSPSPPPTSLWGITKRGGLVVWNCRSFARLPKLDISVACVELASTLPNPKLHCAEITTRTPSVGEHVILLGFRAEIVTGNEQGATIQGDAHVSVGKVTAIYETGRDSVMIPWPALEVASSAKGGLSGGPAFDESGKLVGILGTSFDSKDGSGPLYVSLVWPALTLPIRPTWPEGIYGDKDLLLKDVDDRLCAIEGRDAITDLGNGRFSYKRW